jgi:ribosomal protein S18 acetylase RimI-like enzyme
VTQASPGTVRLKPLDPKDRNSVDEVASLHERYLADSMIVALGPRFLRDVYYPLLVGDRELLCTVAVAQGRVVGFLSYTADSDRFLWRGLRRHLLTLMAFFAIEVIRSPRIVARLFTPVRLMLGRGAAAARVRHRVGEAVSLAIEPAYRASIPEGGSTRLAVRLFEQMAIDLRALGCDAIELNVDPLRPAANRLYTSLGCSLEEASVAGSRINRYTYRLTPNDPK